MDDFPQPPEGYHSFVEGASRIRSRQIELKIEQAKQRGQKRLEKQKSIHKIPLSKAAQLQAQIGAVRTGMDVVDWLKPILLIGLALLFIIGPGVSAFAQIFGALNIWMWVGIIVMVLLIWRNI